MLKRIEPRICVLRVATIGRIDNGFPLGRSAIGQDFRGVRDALNKGMIQDESSPGVVVE